MKVRSRKSRLAFKRHIKLNDGTMVRYKAETVEELVTGEWRWRLYAHAVLTLVAEGLVRSRTAARAEIDKRVKGEG